MELILEILFDYLSLRSSRRNALKVKKIEKTLNKNISSFRCEIKNTFKDYIEILFPQGEINFDSSGKIWNLLDFEDLQKKVVFNSGHKINSKPKKMQLNQKFKNEYASVVLKPNSAIEITIKVNSYSIKRKLNFELAFRRKKLNSKIHINIIEI